MCIPVLSTTGKSLLAYPSHTPVLSVPRAAAAQTILPFAGDTVLPAWDPPFASASTDCPYPASRFRDVADRRLHRTVWETWAWDRSDPRVAQASISRS